MIKKSLLRLLLILVIIGAGLFFFYNSGDHSIIGSNSNGYVTKDVYSHYGGGQNQIAIVTGMHPREKLSQAVIPSALKFYALVNDVEIVNYQVTVTNNPTDFSESRNNGESLVASYITPDIQKSNYGLVIICHDHEKGYGDGYYIATPSMDAKSVALAEAVHTILPNFNYYKRNTEKKAQSSSIVKVDNPITQSGTPVFVYEMPEWHSSIEAFLNSYSLISSSFKVL
ncbi:MAG: hypothetical protein ACPK7O_10780 [Methanobacterium sp.]